MAESQKHQGDHDQQTNPIIERDAKSDKIEEIPGIGGVTNEAVKTIGLDCLVSLNGNIYGKNEPKARVEKTRNTIPGNINTRPIPGIVNPCDTGSLMNMLYRNPIPMADNIVIQMHLSEPLSSLLWLCVGA